MANELTLPELGENITQGTVTKVLVKAGDAVKKGQNILELETDKAVLEVPSNMDGVIGNVLVNAGSVVKIGQSLFSLSGGAAPAAQTPTPTGGHVQQEQQNVSPSTLPSDAGSNVKATQSQPPSTKPSTPGAVSEMTLPALGENIEKGTVTKVLVKVGDQIKKGQNILELETDKAVLEVPAPNEGIVKEVLVQAGAVVKIGQAIFKIESGASAAPTAISTPTPTPQAAPEQKIAASPAAPRNDTQAIPTPRNDTASGPIPIRKDISAAPSVRLLARELGIDIGLVKGSGPGGRISLDDVKAYCKMLNTTRPAGGGGVAQQALPNFAKWGNVKREPMNNVRKKTAEHLSYAWATIPHVTQFEKCDITELEKLRKSASDDKRKLSITPFIIKVMALALKHFPQFNASVDMATSEIVLKDYVNIGVAVDTDRGLIVPVLKNVDKMNILQISDELTAIAEKARAKKITIDDLQGGCMTISNLGGIGGTFFTPIVNSPEVAILGVSRGVMEPIYKDGMFVPRLMLPLSLSYDHRIIDGADGARFIRWISDAISQLSLLDLEK